MKKSILPFFLLLLLPFTRSLGQNHYCTWDTDFTESDIDHTPSRLEARASATFQVDATNKGTCVWRKNEVYIKVTVKKTPKTVSSSEAAAIFKTSQKFYLTNDYVTKGGTGRFTLRFNAVVDAGPYELEFVIMNKDGKRIGDPTAVIYQFGD